MSAVPKLRFPEFDGEWHGFKVGDFFSIQAGGDIDKARLSSIRTKDHPYPVYANSAQRKGLYGYASYYKEEGGCVTVTGRGELGIVNARHERFVPIVRLLVLRPIDASDVDFLASALGRLNIFVESTGVPQLTGPQISGYRIFRPSLPEQQKIASFLSSIDKKIDLLRQKRDALELYKKGLMQKIFSQEIRFKQDDGNDFPDWEEVALGDVFSASKGSGLSKDSISDSGKNACVLYGELYTKYEEEIETVVSKTNVSDGVRSYGNEILVPSSTTTTAIDLVNFTALRASDVLIGGDITILHPKFDLNIKFFAYYLTHAKKYELASRGQGSTIVHLYFQHIKKISISVPPLEEQNMIVSILDALTIRSRSISSSIEQIETFKKGLLQQMFV